LLEILSVIVFIDVILPLDLQISPYLEVKKVKKIDLESFYEHRVLSSNLDPIGFSYSHAFHMCRSTVDVN
jgi:hypothetical protein